MSNGSEHAPELSLEESTALLRERAAKSGMSLEQWKERYAAVPEGPDGTNPDGTFKPQVVQGTETDASNTGKRRVTG